MLNIISVIKEDIRSIQERDPAARSGFEIMLTYSGVHAVIMYRISHKLYTCGFKTLARAVSQFARFLTGIEIHPGAKIGKGLFIDHGMGVVIGETTEIGDNCLLYQGVTLGGTGKEHGKRHPTIGDNVMISAGAKILGSFTIGENSKIGAGSVVLEEVPPNCTVVGVPGRVVKRNNQKLIREDMNQVDLPDPVMESLAELRKENEQLHAQLEELKKKKEKKDKEKKERKEKTEKSNESI